MVLPACRRSEQRPVGHLASGRICHVAEWRVARCEQHLVLTARVTSIGCYHWVAETIAEKAPTTGLCCAQGKVT